MTLVLGVVVGAGRDVDADEVGNEVMESQVDPL